LVEKLEQAHVQLEKLKQCHVEDLQHKNKINQEKVTLENDLRHLRENATLTIRSYDALVVRLEAQKNELSILTQSIVQATEQVSHLTDKVQRLEKNLSSNHSPIVDIQMSLQEALKKRVAIEEALTEARTRFEAYEKRISELKNQLQQVLTSVNDSQATIQELRMTIQRITLEMAHLVEAIEKVNHNVQDICNALDDDATEDKLLALFEKNQQKVTRLGPINLAAIHEHEEVTKRLDYLEKQKEDLLKALDILKEAISKVDKETRERFKQTFDAVNENFSNLFPRIFEGGHAELQLTEDDLLKAGVLVKAQPPGKRNTSIHLLSGGEKTLTAIGLVFALFELNPAPFCILDEVDAPLDDINVGRFCQLLKEMADKTQFLIITHNKVTMEMADVLMGVTMQEAGVSRVVSVTMEDAVKYAKPSNKNNEIDA
jgi:chromosome segregation protein